MPSGSISIATQSGGVQSEWYNVSDLNSFSGLVPNNYVLYVRNVANSCVSQSVSSTKIDPLPALPVVPTVDLLQPTWCTNRNDKNYGSK
jgi:hypothetical protein